MQIQKLFEEHLRICRALAADELIHTRLQDLIEHCVAVYRAGGKTLWAGNGGSAADAQHLAAELSGRFYRNRAPLFAEALHCNSSYLTAVANDFGYEQVFARLAQAMGKAGDVLLLFSTSGNSPNIIEAAKMAQGLGMYIVGFTGQDGGQLAELSNCCLRIPSKDTPRIQEMHIFLGHLLCQGIEEQLFPEN